MNRLEDVNEKYTASGEAEDYFYKYYVTTEKIYITLKPKRDTNETYATSYPRNRYAGKPNGIQKLNFILDAIYQYETGGGIRGKDNE